MLLPFARSDLLLHLLTATLLSIHGLPQGSKEYWLSSSNLTSFHGLQDFHKANLHRTAGAFLFRKYQSQDKATAWISTQDS